MELYAQQMFPMLGGYSTLLLFVLAEFVKKEWSADITEQIALPSVELYERPQRQTKQA